MAEKDKVTIVLFSGEMDKALAALNIAVGAASMDMEVTIFFTFWGLNVIKRNDAKVRSKGILRQMLNFMNKGGSKRLPLSRMNMLGMGPWMMGKLMKEAKFPTVEELVNLAHDMGVKFAACTTTMGFMGLTKDVFLPTVDVYCGVATYLVEAKESKVTLFI
ncbi:MAG: DsrE/DsrF/DrsH-like family protein [Chloroflexi bacterium]|nr:DsrE/DsrF/DrsH-like family protein [Chloroflexota bacterium]